MRVTALSPKEPEPSSVADVLASIFATASEPAIVTLPDPFLPETAVAVNDESPASGPEASTVMPPAPSSVAFCVKARVIRSTTWIAMPMPRPKPLPPPDPVVVPALPPTVTVFFARAAIDCAPVVVTFAPTMRAVVSLSTTASPKAPETSMPPSEVLACPLPRPGLFACWLLFDAPPGLATAEAVTVACCWARMARDAAVVPVALVESIAASVVCAR